MEEKIIKELFGILYEERGRKNRDFVKKVLAKAIDPLDFAIANFIIPIEKNSTLLHWACEVKDIEIVQMLLDMGSDLEVMDEYDYTPLHRAAYANSLAVAELLISSGADLEAKDNVGRTPLHVAAEEDYIEMQDLLISHGGVR